MEHEIARMREEFLSASHSDSRPSVGTVGTNVLLRNRSDDSRAMEVLELSKDILDSTGPHTLMEAAKFGELQYLQGYGGEMEASLSQYLQEQSIPLQGTDIDVLLAHIRAQFYDEADRPFILNIEYKKRKLIRGDGPPLFVVWYMQDLVDRWYASGRREQAASFKIEMCELKRQFLGDGGAQRMSTLEEHAKECYGVIGPITSVWTVSNACFALVCGLRDTVRWDLLRTQLLHAVLGFCILTSPSSIPVVCNAVFRTLSYPRWPSRRCQVSIVGLFIA